MCFKSSMELRNTSLVQCFQCHEIQSMFALLEKGGHSCGILRLPVQTRPACEFHTSWPIRPWHVASASRGQKAISRNISYMQVAYTLADMADGFSLEERFSSQRNTALGIFDDLAQSTLCMMTCCGAVDGSQDRQRGCKKMPSKGQQHGWFHQ